MAASIGGYTVQIWRGELRGPRRRIRTHERNGVDGTGIIRQAYACPVSTIFTIETVADEVTGDLRESQYEALEGTEVTVVDSKGVTHEKVIVVGVDSNTQVRAAIVGGAATSDKAEVWATWRLLLPFSLVKKGGVSQ